MPPQFCSRCHKDLAKRRVGGNPSTWVCQPCQLRKQKLKKQHEKQTITN